MKTARPPARGLRLALAASILCASTVAGQNGFIAGILVDELTGESIGGGTIGIAKSGLETVTAPSGQFLLQGFSTGVVEVRISAPGYVGVVEEIEVSAADFLQIRLRPIAVILDELLVRAGRRSTGTSRPRVEAVSGSHQGWRSALDLLEDDVPGVAIRRGGGNLGTGARIVIRGTGSFMDNSPDVFLDGILIQDSSNQTRAAHVLDLVAAETVARVRVLKGPAASGPFARSANGAIVIETHRGGG
jgi:hypothetical protein